MKPCRPRCRCPHGRARQWSGRRATSGDRRGSARAPSEWLQGQIYRREGNRERFVGCINRVGIDKEASRVIADRSIRCDVIELHAMRCCWCGPTYRRLPIVAVPSAPSSQLLRWHDHIMEIRASRTGLARKLKDGHCRSAKLNCASAPGCLRHGEAGIRQQIRLCRWKSPAAASGTRPDRPAARQSRAGMQAAPRQIAGGTAGSSPGRHSCPCARPATDAGDAIRIEPVGRRSGAGVRSGDPAPSGGGRSGD